ncbi:Malto-oligosyltrehalose trehalohydrolase [Sinorhizobium alkalisoli]|nr:Malto-oligosyltrehalose trehalohydrolase [Sinorhizobium alkalisoli]
MGHRKMLTREARTWGARLLEPGKAEFRIWAPDQGNMAVVVGDRTIEMAEEEGGWFSAVAAADTGSLYQFALSDGTRVSDPASRAQADGVEGPSVLVDQDRYRWKHPDWDGRPWNEAVVYELHVGTFTEEGTFRAASTRIGELARVGVTTVELMPLAQFPGRRGWGYDGVLHFAPHNAYGTPDDLKALVDAAHGHGMMAILDVVYNHFGPVGNALARYASPFFNSRRETPWGAAIDFDHPAVRWYFIENALYWLQDFRFDGLRLDAVDQIKDTQEPSFLQELARTARRAIPDRHIHLTVEDDERRPELVAYSGDGEPLRFSASWNDDFHHAAHVIATGETSGHYQPYEHAPSMILKEILATGFWSRSVGGNRNVGQTTPLSRVAFLQNHDQIGNRALGERLRTLVPPDLLDVLMSLLILSPQIPLLFMGDDYGETRPFHFFADYEGEIADAIRRNRPEEAVRFGGKPEDAGHIPDALDPRTLASCRLNWSRAGSGEGERERSKLSNLIALRMRHIVPILAPPKRVVVHPSPEGLIAIDWHFSQATLQLRANFSKEQQAFPGVEGEVIWSIGRPAEAPVLMAPGILVAVAEEPDEW